MAGTCFVTRCNQCNPMVFVMGFPFKLLEDASLQNVFFILFPLCPGCYSPGIEFLRAYTKRAELVSHTWEFVEMTPICPYNIHKSTPPAVLCRRRPPPPPPPSIDRALSTLPPPPLSADCRRHHLQSSEMGRAPVLDGRRSLGLHKNEQNDGVVGRGGV